MVGEVAGERPQHAVEEPGPLRLPLALDRFGGFVQYGIRGSGRKEQFPGGEPQPDEGSRFDLGERPAEELSEDEIERGLTADNAMDQVGGLSPLPGRELALGELLVEQPGGNLPPIPAAQQHIMGEFTGGERSDGHQAEGGER